MPQQPWLTGAQQSTGAGAQQAGAQAGAAQAGAQAGAAQVGSQGAAQVGSQEPRARAAVVATMTTMAVEPASQKRCSRQHTERGEGRPLHHLEFS